MNLIDAIQDAAVRDGLATEQEVFGDITHPIIKENGNEETKD